VGQLLLKRTDTAPMVESYRRAGKFPLSAVVRVWDDLWKNLTTWSQSPTIRPPFQDSQLPAFPTNLSHTLADGRVC
jgi:hypothetical protein